MTQKQKREITKISKEFALGFKDSFGSINGTGWLIVDPLSAYLNSLGFKNKIEQVKENENHPMVLILAFNDGSRFIPAGRDLSPLNKNFKNWMWL